MDKGSKVYVTHKFYLDDYTKDLLQDLENPFGYNGFGEFLYYRTYSRNINDKQENWTDTVIRVIEGIMSIRLDYYIKNHISWDNNHWRQYASKLAVSLHKMHWSPPGRGLWAMGTQFIYERGGMALYNCAATEVHNDLSDDISWIMDSLMLGVGVGFSPIRDDTLIFKNPKGSYKHIIKDSREGWVESVASLIDAYKYGISKPKFIYDEIREYGLPIKGFGGIASGPEPLKRLHQQYEEAFEKYMTDKYYDSVILKTDLVNQIGCCVVAGNVRRSAELASLSINDPKFINLKNYNMYPERAEWGWMSNNSVNLEYDEDFEKLGLIANRIIANGEPGYINLQNFPYGRIGKRNKIRKDKARCTNPCLHPTLSKILTKEGVKNINDLQIGEKIWSEYGWTIVTNKWSTGINKVYKYTTTAGIFYSTDNHQIVNDHYKVEIQYAASIDILIGPSEKYKETLNPYCQNVVDGLVIGDGEYKNNVATLHIGENDQEYWTKISTYLGRSYNKDYQFRVVTTIQEEELPVTYLRKIPDRFIKSDYNKKCRFLKGLYSANGSICGNRITLKAASFNVIESVQLILSSIGIPSYYTINKEKWIEFDNGFYKCKQSYDLNISQGRELFYENIGFIQGYKQEKLKELIQDINKSYKNYKKSYDIISVELVEECETWDITVDNIFHTFWCNGFNVSNCGEIPLEGGFDKSKQRVREVCNVDETYPTMCSTIEEWYKACEYATFYASTVSLLPTHQPSTNRVVARNRRIGVSIVDFTGWIYEEGSAIVTKYLRKGYKIVRKTNKLLANEAGIPESIRVTTIKPGGTVPKLAGKTSGAGYPNFEYMIRRVRVGRGTQIHNLLVESGISYEADYVSHNTDVFEWPIKCGPAPPVNEISVWQQAMNLVLLQREWADNSVSNTLMFKPKWRLIKRFSLLEGCNKPFESTRNWLSRNTDAHTYDVLMTNFSKLESIFDYNKIKIIQKLNEQSKVEEISIYEYDPAHEEHSIEPLLSAIAPLTKSVSLLPHTNRGVYMQIPEEGITKAEYEHRLKFIRKIDWSRLNSSDGDAETDKFCSGDKCSI